MTEYIITSEWVSELISMHVSDTRKREIRDTVLKHPLSDELKMESERILNDLKEWSYSIHVNNSALIAIQLRERIESLRGEP